MIKLIRAAFDRGVTFFDTAEAYGPFANGELLGDALLPIRDQVVIGTKFGFDIEQESSVRRSGTDCRPEHIRKVAETSLKRLKTDVIDIFYQHRVDPDVPIVDVAGALKKLIAEGKVKHDPPCACRPVAAVESEYSLFYRGAETETPPALDELGIGFVPSVPLARDKNTKFDDTDFRNLVPRFSPEARKANMVSSQLGERLVA